MKVKVAFFLQAVVAFCLMGGVVAGCRRLAGEVAGGEGGDSRDLSSCSSPASRAEPLSLPFYAVAAMAAYAAFSLMSRA